MAKKDSKKKKDKDKKKGKPATAGTAKGRLDITRSGMGFVIVENADTDVIVRPSDFNTALHGDTVRVKIKGDGRGRRMQGEVTEVIKRKQTEFMGHIEMNKNFAFFVAEMEKPMPDIYIPLNKLNGAADKERVIVRMLEWEPGREVLGGRPSRQVRNARR